MIKLEHLIKSWARALGIEIRRVSVVSFPPLQIVSALKTFDIDLILDVGANQGQFAEEMFSTGYLGKIISFEPLSSAYRNLLVRSKGNPRWVIHEKCAIGDNSCDIEINISKNSVSSSLLSMLASHEKLEPESIYVKKERVKMVTLNDVAKVYLNKSKNCFLKIDTQGYEWQVLQGASEIIPLVKGVQIEMSLVPLYENQELWQAMYDRITASGFQLWSIIPGFTDKKTGQTLQFDGVFFRL